MVFYKCIHPMMRRYAMKKIWFVVGVFFMAIFMNSDCKKSITSTGAVTVTDIDGNVYLTVPIGNQWWMAENLRVTHYRNGDDIPHVTDNTTWVNLTTGGYCNYDNDQDHVSTYGRLYNCYAIDDSRNIAPEGWHVPTDEEWKELERSLGMSASEADDSGWRGTDEGGQLKESGTTHWLDPNTGATNASYFSAIPAGCRALSAGNFVNMGYSAYFWSSTETTALHAWVRRLSYNYSSIYRGVYNKEYGFPIRCVRD